MNTNRNALVAVNGNEIELDESRAGERTIALARQRPVALKVLAVRTSIRAGKPGIEPPSHD